MGKRQINKNFRFKTRRLELSYQYYENISSREKFFKTASGKRWLAIWNTFLKMLFSAIKLFIQTFMF